MKLVTMKMMRRLMMKNCVRVFLLVFIFIQFANDINYDI
jgi:hypothetical protein